MTWKELDLNKGEWFIPKVRTKNGQDLLLPLPETIIAMFRGVAPVRGSDLVWPSKRTPTNPLSGYSKAVATLNEKMNDLASEEGRVIEAWSTHDLRRTLVTGMNGLLDERDHPLIPPHVVERIVNHKLPGVQGVYNRHTYYAEKKAALRAWADYLANLNS